MHQFHRIYSSYTTEHWRKARQRLQDLEILCEPCTVVPLLCDHPFCEAEVVTQEGWSLIRGICTKNMIPLTPDFGILITMGGGCSTEGHITGTTVVGSLGALESVNIFTMFIHYNSSCLQFSVTADQCRLAEFNFETCYAGVLESNCVSLSVGQEVFIFADMPASGLLFETVFSICMPTKHVYMPVLITK